MSKTYEKRESKTLRNVQVIEIQFLKDNSENCGARTDEARNLIAQMIDLSHKRGRPTKLAKEVLNAA